MVRRLALVTLVAIASCTFPEQPLPPGERRFVIHAVLDPSKRFQIIDLGTTDGAEANPKEFDNAEVSVTAPDGTVLTAKQDSTQIGSGNVFVPAPQYRIDLEAAGVSLVPGTYQLRIVTSGGDVITGETTMPTASPSAMGAPTEFQRLRDTLDLSWGRVTGARTYHAQIWASQSYDSQGQYIYTRLRYSAFVDTSFALAGTARTWDDEDVFPYFGTARVFVYAVDDNYYEYYRLLGDPFIGAAPSRLMGALGVFGSIVPVAQRELTIKFTQP